MSDAWRWLIAGEWRAHPMRFLLAGLAIAVGVALGFAVHVINRSAADAFGEAVRSVSGAADLQVRATSPLGFSENLYPRIFRLAPVADASPALEFNARVQDRQEPVSLVGIDVLRALTVTPALLGRRLDRREAGPASTRAAGADAALDPEAIYLSQAILDRTRLRPGDKVRVRVGALAHEFTFAGDMPGVPAGQAIAMIDIAAAQWRFGRLGSLSRIDLKLRDGVGTQAARETIQSALPSGTRLADPEGESRRGDSLSRAYRVNLDMLALVALLTGGFLVYSAQSLSVARRLSQFALLRTLGMRKGSIEGQLLAEGLVLGLLGSVSGLLLGYGLAALGLRFVGGDLGGGYFGGTAAELQFAPAAAILFLTLGVATAVGGSYAPARAAGKLAPAVAIRQSGDLVDPRERPRWRPALLLMLLGAGCALLPPIERLPLFGYLAVALVLAGGVAAMPWLARTLLRPLTRFDSRRPSVEMALRRLLGAPSQASTALAGIVASTGLMIAMAIMVTSFRGSVEDWLDTFLSGDLYLSTARSGAVFDPATQTRLAGTPGIADIGFAKTVPLALDPELPSVLLLVRPLDRPGVTLPLIERAETRGVGIPIWLSEPAARLYGKKPGDAMPLPLGRSGGPAQAWVAGIWRDYARQQGAIEIDAADYVRLTGDRERGEAAVTFAPGASPARVRAAIEARLPPELRGRVDIAEPATLRREALRLFDRSFAITYVLEAIAILIGLTGVAATISAQTIARMKEFGMLRHIGMRPRSILAMLASEGVLLGLIGLAAGAVLGLGISQILIHVINPQSFNWTMETRLPWTLLLTVAIGLVTAAAGTAMLAGRRALSASAIRAVSEDW
nr:ABC transporter permease [uncultured Sphingosinicella sp.]